LTAPAATGDTGPVRTTIAAFALALALGAAVPAAGAGAGPGGSETARSAACGTVKYGGRTYVLYYRGIGCRSARRKVRHVHRYKRLPGWKCSSGSNFRTGGYCERGQKHFGWHPGD
jgi:hypothetical protein